MVVDSGEAEALWDLASPPTDADLIEKYRWLAGEGLSASRVAALEEAALHCSDLPDAAALLPLLIQPADRA